MRFETRTPAVARSPQRGIGNVQTTSGVDALLSSCICFSLSLLGSLPVGNNWFTVVTTRIAFCVPFSRSVSLFVFSCFEHC